MARRGAIDRLEEPVRATVDKLIHEGHTTVAISEHLAGLGTSGIRITADFPRVDLIEADSTSTFNKARLVQQGDIFRIETPGISSDYLIAKDASGATSHTWRLGNDVKMLINATGLRLSDSNAATDAEVVAQVEFYRGANDKRVGRIGFPSNIHEHMHIQNQTADGDIRFIFGSTIAGRFDADGGAVIGSPTGASQGPGTLNAKGLFVDGQPVLTDAGSEFETNGYLLLSNGMIVQWGRVTGVTSSGKTAMFPMSFPNAVLTFVASNDFESGSSSVLSTGILSLSDFRLWVNNNGTIPVRWIAIGC